METTKPTSPTTALSALPAEAAKASLSLLQGLLRIAPGLPVAALAGVVIMFGAWSCEHRARQREAIEAQQIKKQSTVEISRLEQQASSAIKDAHESAQAAKELESRRQQLASEADGLRQNLESLRQVAITQNNALAGLTTDAVVKLVAARLQLQAPGAGGQGSVNDAANPEHSAPGKNTDRSLTSRSLDSPSRPATADDTAAAGRPFPPAGEGAGTAGGEGKTANDAALVLSDQGVRKVEGAFEELDSCRQQGQVMSQQVSNCEQRAKLDSALEAQQADTISKLNAALADKDQILSRSEAAHRAELKAVRGSWRTRVYHAAEILAGGIIVGVIAR